MCLAWNPLASQPCRARLHHCTVLRILESHKPPPFNSPGLVLLAFTLGCLAQNIPSWK